MALPPALLNTFLPAELEFVAELEDVDIVPLFRMLPIRTIAVPFYALCSCDSVLIPSASGHGWAIRTTEES